jgi:hypothetical protein
LSVQDFIRHKKTLTRGILDATRKEDYKYSPGVYLKKEHVEKINMTGVLKTIEFYKNLESFLSNSYYKDFEGDDTFFSKHVFSIFTQHWIDITYEPISDTLHKLRKIIENSNFNVNLQDAINYIEVIAAIVVNRDTIGRSVDPITSEILELVGINAFVHYNSWRETVYNSISSFNGNWKASAGYIKKRQSINKLFLEGKLEGIKFFRMMPGCDRWDAFVGSILEYYEKTDPSYIEKNRFNSNTSYLIAVFNGKMYSASSTSLDSTYRMFSSMGLLKK